MIKETNSKYFERNIFYTTIITNKVLLFIVNES